MHRTNNSTGQSLWVMYSYGGWMLLKYYPRFAVAFKIGPAARIKERREIFLEHLTICVLFTQPLAEEAQSTYAYSQNIKLGSVF